MPLYVGDTQIMAGQVKIGDSAVAVYLGDTELVARDAGLSLDDWTLPAGKQNASGPILIQAEAGTGTGGYPLGLWEAPSTDLSITGFGTVIAGSLQFTHSGLTSDFSEVKFRNDGNNSRMAVSRFNLPSPPHDNAHVSNWLQTLAGGEFMFQTANRTIRLPTSTATDRSQGVNWISWWIHPSTRTNSMLDADDMAELNRVRDNADRFLAGFIYNT